MTLPTRKELKMNYKVINCKSLAELELRVWESIMEGWGPLGGVTFAEGNYLQAMLR